MEEMQSKLTSPPVIALPWLNGNLTFYNDEGDRKGGCMLLKDQPDWTRKP